MPNLNQVTLCGHLTREPELKRVASGLAICELGLAVNNRIKRGEEWLDEPCFIDVTTFAKQAEYLAEHAHKGGAVLVTGHLKQEQWEKDGQRRSKHKVVAERVQLLTREPRDSYSQERPEAPGEYDQSRQAAAKGHSPPPASQDDIPF